MIYFFSGNDFFPLTQCFGFRKKRDKVIFFWREASFDLLESDIELNTLLETSDIKLLNTTLLGLLNSTTLNVITITDVLKIIKLL